MTGDVNKTKSISGYVTIFEGGVVLCQTKFQKYIALSTIEVKYIVGFKACKETLYG